MSVCGVCLRCVSFVIIIWQFALIHSNYEAYWNQAYDYDVEYIISVHYYFIDALSNAELIHNGVECIIIISMVPLEKAINDRQIHIKFSLDKYT